jgi:hypothetical protein
MPIPREDFKSHWRSLTDLAAILLCRKRAKTGREQMQQHAVRGRQSYSITSSAMASSLSGTVRPSIRAVEALMTSSTSPPARPASPPA